MADWEIKKTTGFCYGTQRELEPGEEYFAVLTENEDGNLERRDFSRKYWMENQLQVFYFWKSRIPLPDENKKTFIDDEMLLAFYERLSDEENEEKINFRYILALILMRKRILKYQNSQSSDGVEIWNMRTAGTNKTSKLIKPELSPERIDALTENIREVLLED
ncbi:hypothetical protein SMSP2_01156 [Limihaloglobus sulfuriphilus]|uniref:Uncharacterized protein n=1 Tax=Limihaloglobus sulfuriphilus TaxID=1851148 RepID=A0A1Q2MDN1_9BACT|nr:hypothetical protein [Limihaloglobus sulfuriphilus]AQQ70795.1 hypothetical protein SMSP2_01156 [Limihaloglobus sulfuriphilus]